MNEEDIVHMLYVVTHEREATNQSVKSEWLQYPFGYASEIRSKIKQDQLRSRPFCKTISGSCERACVGRDCRDD